MTFVRRPLPDQSTEWGGRLSLGFVGVECCEVGTYRSQLGVVVDDPPIMDS